MRECKSFLIVIALIFAPNTVHAGEKIVFIEGSFSGKAGETIELLKSSDKPLHIGDRGGYIADIPEAHFDKNAPFGYGWRFTIDGAINEITLSVTMYSLTQAYGCSTVISLNGEKIKDLSLLRDAGDWRDASYCITLNLKHIREGLNEIKIEEEQCRKTYRPAWNDSLIKELRLELK